MGWVTVLVARDGSGTLLKARKKLGDPQGGLGWVVAWEGLGGPREVTRLVAGSSERFGTGRETLL